MSGPPAGNGLGYEILGAVKVKDGLFIGDELAAQDLEFVVSNKVTRIINTCGRQVPNHWETIGVVYLTYYWVDADTQVILDGRDVVANEIFRFVEEALNGAESVLIHSVRGQSRSCCVLSAYMMAKHRWGLRKTMEFLSFRRPDMNLKPTFLQQLSGYERRLMASSKLPFSHDWNDVDTKDAPLECEERLLRNTYINSQMGPLAEFRASESLVPEPKRLMWADGDRDDLAILEQPPGAGWGPGPPAAHAPRILKTSTSAGGSMAAAAPPPMPPMPAAPQASAWQPTPYAENPEVQHPPPAKMAAPTMQPTAQYSSPAPQYPTAPATSAGPPEVVTTAWAADGEAWTQHGVGGRALAAAQGLAPEIDRRLSGRSDLSDKSTPPSVSLEAQLPVVNKAEAWLNRGPATTIRDSLGIQQPMAREARRDSSGSSRPPSRDLSRDPSPKTGNAGRRGESPSTRGKPLGRYVSPTGRAPASPFGYPTAPSSGRTPTAGYPGLTLSGVRTGQGAPLAPGSGPRGMGAFRSGGPVRAKADLFGADANSSFRRREDRPSSASRPLVGGRPSSRPASPVGHPAQPRPSSRPSSPHSAARAAASGPTSAPPLSRPSMSYPHASTSRNLSAHMRRAPSPTPAFNRNPSPSKPRWRS
mmetsp:Transcript_53881/g.117576  ORF Transcript_53881/g.117576 Transcript_53881/m.117576 type:complete len:644 (+) Transcript_53881:135-2066(+)